jgi:hypothetical protein
MHGLKRSIQKSQKSNFDKKINYSWMSKTIYCIKMFLLNDELNLSAKIEASLKEICLFFVLVYVRFYFIFYLTDGYFCMLQFNFVLILV